MSKTNNKIVLAPDERLRTRCEEAQPTEIDHIASDMMEMIKGPMKDQIVGLAANQIGYNKRILFYSDGGEWFLMVSPVITHRSDIHIVDQEGCASIPGVKVLVKRPDQITVDYYDGNFKNKKEKFHGWVARVIMHEIDHLDGILITDYDFGDMFAI